LDLGSFHFQVYLAILALRTAISLKNCLSNFTGFMLVKGQHNKVEGIYAISNLY